MVRFSSCLPFVAEPNLRLKMRVVLMNAAGLYEAGIDGGGLFREFTNEVLKAAFDPNRGFFKLTRDQNLYPNPNVDQIHENYVPHYYFIGRMLGKVSWLVRTRFLVVRANAEEAS